MDVNPKRSQIYSITTDFVNTSTLQFLTKVYLPESKRWKFFWISIFMCLAAGCAYQMWSIFDKYYSYESSISMKIEYGALDLPSLTACNTNPVRESRVMNSGDQQWIDAYTYWPQHFTTLKDRHMHYLSPEERLTFGHQLEALLPHCKSPLSNCTDSWSASESFAYGNCYTYNSGDLRNTSMLASSSGLAQGQYYMFYTETHEYLRAANWGTGLLLDIHSYNTINMIEEYGVAIPTGFHTYISMKQRQIKRLEPPYGQCDAAYAKAWTAEYGKVYTVETCNKTCIHHWIAKECQCLIPNYRKFYPKAKQNLRPCERPFFVGDPVPDDEICHQKLMEEVYTTKVKACSCPLPCSETKFDLELSALPAVTDRMWYTQIDMICTTADSSEAGTTRSTTGGQRSDSLCAVLRGASEELKDTFTRKNLAMLTIFYRDLNHEIYEEQIVYEKSQLLADFGGNVGLWIGASIFTVLELFELFMRLGWASLCRPNKKQITDIEDHTPEATNMDERDAENVAVPNMTIDKVS